jgi:hypothetical protein
MKPEDFEQKLRQQSLRQIPGEWRAEIFSAASATEKRRERRSAPSLSYWQMALAKIFWPNPKAWAGLATVWIFIFILNFSMRDKSPAVAGKISPPSPEMVAELRQQQRLFAELLGVNDLRIADRPKVFSPQPRSERAEFLTA